MAGLNIDLRYTHKHRNIGDLIIVYTWVNDERAMILIPARRQGSPWYIVMESNAYQYDDMQQLQAKAINACEVLGMRPVPENWYKIAKIIHEGLPDLISMPSAPPHEFYAANFGRLMVKADGQQIAEEDIKLERVGAEYA